jgi:hypothetical protein
MFVHLLREAVARSDSVKTQSRLRLLEEKMNLLADLQHEEERRRSIFPLSFIIISFIFLARSKIVSNFF